LPPRAQIGRGPHPRLRLARLHSQRLNEQVSGAAAGQPGGQAALLDLGDHRVVDTRQPALLGLEVAQQRQQLVVSGSGQGQRLQLVDERREPGSDRRAGLTRQFEHVTDISAVIRQR